MHEEVNYFPAIEKATGQKGVMDGEAREHGKSLFGCLQSTIVSVKSD